VQITGTYAGLNGNETTEPDFYALYAEERRKPMMLTETAALYNLCDLGPSSPGCGPNVSCACC
jgi:hypothetical protein